MRSSAFHRRWNRVIAIDGPAASGKSSVARRVARQLGFIYVNSGAIYRAFTWHFLENGIGPEQSARIVEILKSLPLACVIRNGEARIFVDHFDPAGHLRDDRVNESVSRVSRIPEVREIVSERLHDCAQSRDVVIEGRDIGSVVFPDTPYKFYIDASPAVRLQRRAAQGERDEITVRDHDDVSRTVSPLVKARDAYVIDTSHVTVEQVVTAIITQLERAGLPISDIQITNRTLGE
jgi:cytidylate kinase